MSREEFEKVQDLIKIRAIAKGNGKNKKNTKIGIAYQGKSSVAGVVQALREGITIMEKKNI